MSAIEAMRRFAVEAQSGELDLTSPMAVGVAFARAVAHMVAVVEEITTQRGLQTFALDNMNKIGDKYIAAQARIAELEAICNEHAAKLETAETVRAALQEQLDGVVSLLEEIREFARMRSRGPALHDDLWSIKERADSFILRNTAPGDDAVDVVANRRVHEIGPDGFTKVSCDRHRTGEYPCPGCGAGPDSPCVGKSRAHLERNRETEAFALSRRKPHRTAHQRLKASPRYRDGDWMVLFAVGYRLVPSFDTGEGAFNFRSFLNKYTGLLATPELLHNIQVEAQRAADRLRPDLTCSVELYNSGSLRLVWRYKTTKMRKGDISG